MITLTSIALMNTKVLKLVAFIFLPVVFSFDIAPDSAEIEIKARMINPEENANNFYQVNSLSNPLTFHA
jgi:hypothetical protein